MVGKGTVGIVTTTYSHSRADVRRWPDDPDVRRTLEEYFDNFPAGSRTVESLLDGRRLDFRGADLSGLDFTEAALSEANLSGVRLVGADLYGAWLIDAVLRGADLSQCRLRKVQGRACDAQDAILCEADLERSEFENADFRRADFREAYFGRAWMLGADFRGADLRQCIFGQTRYSTGFIEAKFADCLVEGARGRVSGPVDVGADSPQLLDGADLQRWFADCGAPLVEVWQPAQQ
jgi:uncharacterized protein YjbI with pentapeptide repeats